MSSTVWVMFIYYLIFKPSYGSRLCCKDTKPRVFQAVRRPLFYFRIGCSKSTSNQKLSKHFFCSINLRLIISADWQGRRMYHCAERLLRTCCLRWFAPKSLVLDFRLKQRLSRCTKKLKEYVQTPNLGLTQKYWTKFFSRLYS